MATFYARRSGPDKIKSLVDSCELFLFDCDGVIWKGDQLIKGAPEMLAFLRGKGKNVSFVTNNSAKSRNKFLSKFHKLGLSCVSQEEVFCSAFASAFYLSQNKPLDPARPKVYVVGREGICEELDKCGIPWVGGPDHDDISTTFEPVEIEKDIGAVVAGLDWAINYHKLHYASLCIASGARFIATNTDRKTHLTPGQVWPGAGAIVGSIQACSNLTPEKTELVGKPSPILIDLVMRQRGITDRSKICMVGDRLDTDMLFGHQNGLQTILTLSGITERDSGDTFILEKDPDLIIEDVKSLITD